MSALAKWGHLMDGGGSGPRRRVGVMFPSRNPASPENWSGSPAGLWSGLAGLGVEVVPIGTAALNLARVRLAAARFVSGGNMVAQRSPARIRLRSIVLAKALARAGRLDAVVAMGTDAYDLSWVRDPHVPTATFDDATLDQQWRNADSDIRGALFPEDAVRGWCENQAASSRAADVCCVSTAWAARSFVRDYGVPVERTAVVGMGHRPRTSVVGGRDWSAPRFLMVGVDWRRKNGEAVLRAFREVHAIHPDARLDIVGKHPALTVDGVTGHGVLRRDDLQAQKRLDGLFGQATAFVLPSRFDPSPIAYLEAASAGLPVVATTEGGAGELLGTAALSVHPDDHDGLVRAMLALSDPETARTMGAEAARRAADSSWTDVAGRVLAALSRTSQGGATPIDGN